MGSFVTQPKARRARRLGINGSFLAQRQTGVQRYARELTRALTDLDDRSFETVILAPGVAPSESIADHVVRDNSSLPLPAWVQMKLPVLCRRHSIDLLWSPCNMGPLVLANQLLTLHDASPFASNDWFSWPFRTYTRLTWPRLARRVRRVITDSEFSREELDRFGIADRETVSVVPCGVDPFWSPRAPTPAVTELGEYVLTMGGGNPRKNVAGSVQAWRLLGHDLRSRHKLVVVGGGGAIFAHDGVRGSEDIVELQDVDDETLAALYTSARAFLYPSLYEGFGLPPLEALACGTVCLVSDGSSLPEVLGDSVLYCDPLQPASIARGLETLLTDEDQRAALDLRRQDRIDRYRWPRSAALLAKLIESEL